MGNKEDGVYASDCELTILMPCLNEAETLEQCIAKAQRFLSENEIDGEILVSDNGSTDGSQQVAIRNGARVVDAPTKGYGAALIAGINAAAGRFIIMGDADDSYDFYNLMPYVEKLREGYELVMGNRFSGGIEDGAMPPLHKYIGNPVLSFIGRLFYGSNIGDFHCGLRGFNRDSIRSLQLHTTGMEFASEMVVQSELNGLSIAEVPTTLKRDGRSRPPHLRSWHDGWRHLKFLLMHSPNWLFFYPGSLLLILGLIGAIPLCFSDISIGNLTLGVHSLLYFFAFIIIGITTISFGFLTRLYAANYGFLPEARMPARLEKVSLELVLVIGAILVLLGIALSVYAFSYWGQSSFGNLQPEAMMRIIIPAVSSIIIGGQVMFTSFFAGIISIPDRRKR